jgi:hypothetical protein
MPPRPPSINKAVQEAKNQTAELPHGTSSVVENKTKETKTKQNNLETVSQEPPKENLGKNTPTVSAIADQQTLPKENTHYSPSVKLKKPLSFKNAAHVHMAINLLKQPLVEQFRDNYKDKIKEIVEKRRTKATEALEEMHEKVKAYIGSSYNKTGEPIVQIKNARKAVDQLWKRHENRKTNTIYLDRVIKHKEASTAIDLAKAAVEDLQKAELKLENINKNISSLVANHTKELFSETNKLELITKVHDRMGENTKYLYDKFKNELSDVEKKIIEITKQFKQFKKREQNKLSPAIETIDEIIKEFSNLNLSGKQETITQLTKLSSNIKNIIDKTETHRTIPERVKAVNNLVNSVFVLNRSYTELEIAKLTEEAWTLATNEENSSREARGTTATESPKTLEKQVRPQAQQSPKTPKKQVRPHAQQSQNTLFTKRNGRMGGLFRQDSINLQSMGSETSSLPSPGQGGK